MIAGLLLWWSVFGTVQAQVRVNGRVVDSQTRQPLAFVTILESGTSNGVYADIDGYFSIILSAPQAMVSFSYVGYSALRTTWDGTSPWIVTMAASSFRLQEARVVAGENPADIILRKVIAARDRNNPEKSASFSYESYNKFILKAEEDTLPDNKPFSPEVPDSIREKMKAFMDSQHLFLSESISKRKHLPPDRDEEVVLANRVSGFQSAPFTMLGTQLQSFSVYTESIQVLDVPYLSPLAGSALSKYFFTLEDTAFIGNDTVYTISFHPRKGKNFKGLTGTLSVNNNGWAVQHFIATPAKAEESVQIRIQQQYLQKEGAWFPEQLNAFLRFPAMAVNGMNVVGEARSYIRKLEVNPPLRNREFGPVVLRMDPRAAEVPDSLWNEFREHPLELKEQRTYTFMDSLGEAQNFDRNLKLLTMLTTGQLPIGKISIDLNRLIGLNEYEGFRLGAGAHTNDFLSRRFSVGGYYAYGFKDKGHKYGGDIRLYLQRKRDMYVQVLYASDVKEAGGNQAEVRRTGFITNSFYPLLISHMDQVEKWEARLNGRMAGNLTANAFVNRQEIAMYKGNIFFIPRDEASSVIIRSFRIAEAGLHLRWAPGERLAETGTREVVLSSRWPVWYFRYTAGITDNLSASDRYYRYDVLVDKTFRTPLWGDLSIRVHGGYIPGDLPLSLYYNARGTNTINFSENRYLGIASPFNFETMRTNEFLHNRYVAVHLRHSFRDLLYSTKKFHPTLTLVHNMIWGDLKNPFLHSRPARQADKGFFESGLCIDQLIKSGFSGLGLGIFYRYGPYALPAADQNLVVKISSTFTF